MPARSGRRRDAVRACAASASARPASGRRRPRGPVAADPPSPNRCRPNKEPIKQTNKSTQFRGKRTLQKHFLGECSKRAALQGFCDPRYPSDCASVDEKIVFWVFFIGLAGFYHQILLGSLKLTVLLFNLGFDWVFNLTSLSGTKSIVFRANHVSEGHIFHSSVVSSLLSSCELQ